MSCREPGCECSRFAASAINPTECQCSHSCVRHRVARATPVASSMKILKHRASEESIQVNERPLQTRLSNRNSTGSILQEMTLPRLHLENHSAANPVPELSSPDGHQKLSSQDDQEKHSSQDGQQKLSSQDGHQTQQDTTPAISPPPISSPSEFARITVPEIPKSVASNFAEALPHAFDKVKDQLDTGMAEVYRLKQFVLKLCQLQQDFATEVGNLVKSEKKKISAWRKPDFMVACGSAVMDLFDRAEELSQIHTWFASEARLSVVEPLQTFEEIAKPILSRIIDTEKDITQAMDSRRQMMEKKKQECLRMLSTYGPELGLDESTERPLSNRSGKVFHKIGSRAANLLGKQEEAKLRNAALLQKTCASYSDEVQVSNQMLHSYTSREIPDLLSEMQSLEEMRINSIRGHLEAFGRLFIPMAKRYQILSDNLAKSCSLIDVAKDIQGFCSNTASQYAEGSRRLDLFQYELFVPLERINQVTNLSDQQCCMFKTSLQSIMDSQRESSFYPEHTLPNIFTILKAAIIRSGGLKTEGIFRISPESSVVVDLARQIDTGDLFLDADISVHAFAALLKKWMRELTSPVIPEKLLYQRCVNVGKSAEPPSALELDAILNEIPATNALLFAAVVHLIRQFAAHQHENRMSASNLCIVLVPSVLRCPSSLEPMQMMKNAQHEAKFLEHCVERLDLTGQWKYPQNEEDDASLFLQTPRQRPAGSGGSSGRQTPNKSNPISPMPISLHTMHFTGSDPVIASQEQC